MKELRPSDTLRGFFAFDTQQRAILLCGGDKARSGGRRSWYRKMIRRADALLDQHLEQMYEDLQDATSQETACC